MKHYISKLKKKNWLWTLQC